MNRTDTGSPYQRKYPGTCDIDLTMLTAQRLAEGDSPVDEAYEVPDEFRLTEAELAELLDDRAIDAAEAIDAGHPAVWVLARGEEYSEASETRHYADRELARGDFAAFGAELLDRWGAGSFHQATVGADGSVYLQVQCDYVRLDAQLLTTQSWARVPDGPSADIAWAAIETARPALPR